MEIFFRRVLVYLPDQRQEEIMYHFKKVVENHFNCPYYLRVEVDINNFIFGGNDLKIEEFKDITNNDMHIIEAIGLSGENTMSSVAKKLKITAGSLTTAVNALVRKAYVKRERSEEDRRVVYIALTEKGEKAFYHHEQFHRQMTNAVIEKLDDEEIDALVKMLKDISAFFRSYQS